MGGTLTLLIRFRVGPDVANAGREVGALYGVNTLGAALGCFLTDFALVPHVGVTATQLVAVCLNLLAALGALRLAGQVTERQPSPTPLEPGAGGPVVAAMTASLFFSGAAAMGVELLWLRHLMCIMGGYRAAFSLMLAVVLVGFWLGAAAGGALSRRLRRPAALLAAAQAALVISTLYGLARTDARAFFTSLEAAKPAFLASAGWGRELLQLTLNLELIAPEVLLPAVCMGIAYPLANAVVQSVSGEVGRRAGLLYLGNTAGAVVGSLVAGFVLLPRAGLQGAATWLGAMSCVGLACAGAASWLDRRRVPLDRALALAFAGSIGAAVVAIGLWARQAPDALVQRSLPLEEPGASLVTLEEGLTEIVAVTRTSTGALVLNTDGHPMSGTTPESQRYMRAFAHVPLLTAENPDTVLVICFGVGNTLHAASLHPQLRRLELVDLSENVLSHADTFQATNGGVLRDPRVAVFVNDGRQHLRMTSERYDLITMEPPPITFAGVASLYSREFYELARSRLKPGGFVTQWLPAYQVPGGATLSIIRAFLDVFPAAVLLSGSRSELILMGTTDGALTVDPARMAARLAQTPAIAEDLRRVDLGTLTELIGTFAASAPTLERATARARPVTDDDPAMEYVAHSQLVAT